MGILHAFIPVIVVATIGNFSMCAMSYAQIPDQEYGDAIRAVRSGQNEKAIVSLTEWVGSYPEHPRAVFDLVTLLSQVGRDAETLAHRQAVPTERAPVYALAAFGKAARFAGQLDDAEDAYRLALRKTPDDGELLAALAHVRVARGQVAEARRLLLEYLRVVIGAYCVIWNARIEQGVVIEPFCHIPQAKSFAVGPSRPHIAFAHMALGSCITVLSMRGAA